MFRAAIVWVLSATSVVCADDTHYQTFLIGERALGMGGAATGVANESSATFYNPAGIALMDSDALGGNLSVNAFDRRVIEDGYGSLVGVRDLRATSRPGVPLFGSFVKRIGPRDENGVRRHAFALSTVNTINRRLRYEVEVLNMDTRVRESLKIENEQRTTWYGPTLALRLRDDLAIGLSAFWVRQRFRHREDSTNVTDLTFSPERGTFENETAFVRENLAIVSTHHLAFRLGAAWSPTPHWRIGLMFQPPGIELRDNARIQERRILADTIADPAFATLQFSDQRGLGGALPIPWRLRLGGAYEPFDGLLIGADVSFIGRVGRPNDPVRRFGSPDADPVTGFVPQPGDYVSQSSHREFTFNFSVGLEAVLAGVVPLRVGFFTDRSAAPEVDNPTNVYQPVHVDRYGSTLSVGVRSGDYDISLGAAVLFGRGDGLRTNPFGVDDPPETYLPTQVTDRTVYFFISGYKRAASRLARRVIRNRRRRNREEEPRDSREGAESTADVEPPGFQPTGRTEVGPSAPGLAAEETEVDLAGPDRTEVDPTDPEVDPADPDRTEVDPDRTVDPADPDVTDDRDPAEMESESEGGV
ncbi:MAG: hypothetical protein AAGE52_17620 [Myxococcota bacterium]